MWPMFSRSISLLEVRLTCRLTSVQAGSIVTVEYVTVLGECCLAGCEPSFNLIILVFVSRAVSLFQVDLALSTHIDGRFLSLPFL